MDMHVHKTSCMYNLDEFDRVVARQMNRIIVYKSFNLNLLMSYILILILLLVFHILFVLV